MMRLHTACGNLFLGNSTTDTALSSPRSGRESHSVITERRSENEVGLGSCRTGTGYGFTHVQPAIEGQIIVPLQGIVLSHNCGPRHCDNVICQNDSLNDRS